jgi:hypothetical protein
MQYVEPKIGDTVQYHERGGHGSAGFDGPATVTAVDGTRCDLSGAFGTRQAVENVDFGGDPAAAPAYWASETGGGLEIGDPGDGLRTL